jgi:hypothetical protein
MRPVAAAAESASRRVAEAAWAWARAVSATRKRAAMPPPKFRPCIDLHDGVVKQIVGGTLRDAAGAGGAGGGGAVTNFVATKPAEDFARCGLPPARSPLLCGVTRGARPH